MSDQKQNGGPGPLVLFPEVIFVSIVAVLLPLPLAHLLLSGRVFMGIAGFVFWLVALFLTLRFIRHRQYALVWIPMLVMIGLFFIIKKLSG